MRRTGTSGEKEVYQCYLLSFIPTKYRYPKLLFYPSCEFPFYHSNQHFLYKTDIEPLRVTMTNYEAIPQELRGEGYNHIGDIDILDGIIYSGIEGGPTARLASWNTTDLSFISSAVTDLEGFSRRICFSSLISHLFYYISSPMSIFSYVNYF